MIKSLHHSNKFLEKTMSQPTIEQIYQGLEWLCKSNLNCNEQGVITIQPLYPSYTSHIDLSLTKHSIQHVIASNGVDILCSENQALDFVNLLERCCPEMHFFEKWYAAQHKETELPTIQFMRTRPEAVIPSKARLTDVGYDLTLIQKDRVVLKGQKTVDDDDDPGNDNTNELSWGSVVLYDTGIVVKPPFGYYVEVVPRSSLVKFGYGLANNTGIIDPNYRGNIKVALIQHCPNAKPIELPFTACQLILRTMNHAQVQEVDCMDNTQRQDGGFGSTGNRIAEK